MRVEEGALVTIDHVDLPIGEQLTLKRVLFFSSDNTRVSGTPFIESATVTGIIEEQNRGPKIRVFRKKRRKGWRRTIGHRACLTRVRITDITAG